MRRHGGQRGSAMVLLLVVMIALAGMAAFAVVVAANEQRATANDRMDKKSRYYAEALLQGAIVATKSAMAAGTYQSGAFVTKTQLEEGFAAALSDAADASAVKSYEARIVDNPATIDASTVAYDAGGPSGAPDKLVWVYASVTYGSNKHAETTRLRQLVGVTTATSSSSFPKAALYTDGDINAGSGSGDVYAVNPDGSALIDTPPYDSAIMAGGNINGNWSTNLAKPGSTSQSLGIRANGNVNLPGIVEQDKETGPGTVPSVSTYFNTAYEAQLVGKAKQGTPTRANSAGTVVDSTLKAKLQSTAAQTYNATSDLVVNGDLVLGGGESTFNFKSLYVTGNLTLNGNTHTNTTALYVGGKLTISGPSGRSQFGPTYVGGNVSLGGPLSVETTDYTDPSAQGDADKAYPFYVGGNFASGGGPFTHVFGPMWVQGSVSFSGSNTSILCPILCTSEQITTSGSGNFGTLEHPMILYNVCDHDGLYRTLNWGSNGVFTGLMIAMESSVGLPGGNGSQTDIVGAIWSYGDINFGGNTGVCYNQAVLDKISATMTTTTSVIDDAGGSWQELPVQ